MTIQKKTTLYIGLTFGASLALLLAFSYQLLEKRFAELETLHARRDMRRVVHSMEDELTFLARMNGDWAAWDDTYDFIETRDPDYIASNLPLGTFSELSLNYILFVNTGGSIVWQGGADPATGQWTAVPVSLLETAIDPAKPLLKAHGTGGAVRGFFGIPEGLLMLSAQPIMRSDDSGPGRGTLVFARVVDPKRIRDIGALSDMTLSIELRDPGLSREEERKTTDGSGRSDPLRLTPLDRKTLEARYQLRDIYGEPVATVRGEIPRTIHLQGLSVRKTLFLSVFLVGVLLCSATIFLVARLVIRKLVRLRTELDAIRTSQRLDGRVSVPGSDEFSDLASRINGMLDALETASTERYRDLFENARDAIFIVDADLRYIDCNRRAEEIFGFTRDEFLTMSILDVIPPEQIDTSYEVLGRLRKTGAYENFRGKMRTRQGAYLDIEVSSSAIFEGSRFAGSRDIVRDITGRLQAEKALLESEKRFRQIFRYTRNPILMINGKNDRIIDLNDAAAATFGFAKDDAVQRFEDGLKPEDRDKWRNALALCEKRETTSIERLHFADAAGDTIALSARIQSIRMANESIWYCTFTDITEKIELDTRWRLSLRKIVEMEKMAYLGTIVSGFAHDINNPNQLIGGNIPLVEQIWQSTAELLAEQAHKDGGVILGGLPFSMVVSRMPQIIDDIKTGSLRIAEIINNLLLFAKGGHDSLSDLVHLNAVVDAALLLLKHRIRTSFAKVTFTPGTDLPTFRGNRLQMEQVVINLVLNAIDALENPEADVTIQTHYDQATRSVVLRVIDDGTGMTNDVMRQMKTPFFTTRKESGNIGIGLTISDAFVRAHGATLDFVSTPGRGTTATLAVPLPDNPSSVEAL